MRRANKDGEFSTLISDYDALESDLYLYVSWNEEDEDTQKQSRDIRQYRDLHHTIATNGNTV